MSEQEKKERYQWPPKWRPRAEPHVLVGFGKHSLISLMAERHTEEGWRNLAGAMDIHHWPPCWRRASVCTEEEIACFQAFVNLVQKQIEKENE